MNLLIKSIGFIIIIVFLIFGLKAIYSGKEIKNTYNSDIQEINMQIGYSGYSPNSFIIKNNVQVIWNVQVNELTACNERILMKEYNIDVQLKKGKNTIEFTPTKTGTVIFTCGMGMLKGSFLVTDTGEATKEQIEAATPKNTGSSCGCGRAS